ncbi:MAG: M56 family metallopeptidase [Candidatus Azobacteroides sp.]|nr:M56 family metallopeptidase [Candidatus Azobacteroides sp.]
MDTLVWLLKVNIAITLLYAFYKLFFQKDTFFNVKRVILLSSLFFSLVYPFFDVKELFLSKSIENFATVELPEFLVSGAEKSPQTMSVMNLAGIIWVTGVILLFLYFVFQIISILSKILISKRTKLLGINVYVLKNLKSPFSFFNYILIDPDFHDEQELSEILHHEKTHVRERHTYDVIFSELFCILCWFNPFVWLMKKEIRINLEFLADNFVMKSVKNTEHYQLHLLRLSYHKAIAQLSNNFNVSPLKKRIQMMNKKKSSNAGMIKYALFVPLFACLLFVNNLQAQNDKNGGEQTQKSQVVDVPVDKNVFTHVEQMPQFPGGEAEMMNYLAQNIKYPADAQTQGIQGMVVVRFVVSKSGEISDVIVLRPVGSSLDNEAVRVVSAMPNWIPGKQGGKEVDVYYTIPIRFSLQASNDNVVNKKEPEIPDDVVFIVDGKTVSREEIEKISPDKIESVNVLKNESPPQVIITLKK